MSGRRRRDERGLSVSVEAAIIIPVLVLFVGLVITVARMAIAEQHVGMAAAAAVRAASLERTEDAAGAAALAAATSALAERGVECASTTVDILTGDAAGGLGEKGSISASVTCVVDLRDVALPLIPGQTEVTASRVSPVDPYRGR